MRKKERGKLFYNHRNLFTVLRNSLLFRIDIAASEIQIELVLKNQNLLTRMAKTRSLN